MRNIILLACGGREYRDAVCVSGILDAIHRLVCVKLVIHGGALGADRLAEHWAYSRGLPAERFPANWNAHKKAAGAIRNQEMLDYGYPHLVVAFPGGPGTRDMIQRAEKEGVPTWITEEKMSSSGQTLISAKLVFARDTQKIITELPPDQLRLLLESKTSLL